uniref:slit homolog 2 protein isoform X2 n=1 Tax=Ciona intestinalis TaxID=7719 RepID=UPI000180D258|nr:slit homolog 2 protein isoform X2 [Ciona intestinalis]|eukprot:XP_026691209.1 slit homolog 2 protein isoform X2 [Ciona intestinalis]
MWKILFLFTVCYNGFTNACPNECVCRGKTVTCTGRSLTYIPRNIPQVTERLELHRNNITQITRNDLSGLTHLRKLYLQQNKITTIDDHAFQGLSSLRTLQLDQNMINCIQDQTFRPLRSLEVLTLNNNNLSHVSPLVLRGKMPHLRTLRLHTNPIRCNCHMAWLADWLSDRPTMAVFTQCAEPISLRGLNLASADRSEFLCNEITAQRAPTCEISSCPSACICSNGIADCRDRGLTALPASFPLDTTELRLEQNRIQLIPSFAFASYPQLRRIDISNNEIREIERDAFDGLTQLTSLVIYGNRISSLPAGIFRDLRNLQMLLLNANKLTCLRRDVFNGLRSLTLLSLYDNKLQSISRGTFSNLKSIETMHLAQNPFICDCHLRWLVSYVKKYKVETSGARCAGPRRMANKRISVAKTRRMRCTDSSSLTGPAAECIPEAECPSQCRCEGSVVDCSRQGLVTIPDNIPPYASELILSHNRIEMITSVGYFKKLRNLKKIDLSNNQLAAIEDGSFSGAESVLELWLNDNVLSDLRGSMFSGLHNLRTLLIRNNHLSCIGNHTFAGLSTVRHLALYSNQITTILSGAFSTMTSLSTLNLLSNPLDCNCHLSWLSTWLRQSHVASGNPRCAEPRFLREFPVADINPRDFRCSTDHEARAAPTCLPVQKCPEQCTCEGTIVRCANAGLTSVPVDDIPHDVTELYLEMNDIREIPVAIKKFIYLTTLDLSNNELASVSDWMFSNLTRLSTLLLAYNRLRCIPPKAFAGLRSLRILSLHSNELSSLPEGAFNDLTSLSHVGFGANPWYCDCNLRWFSQWVKSDFFEAGIARCSAPPRMAGRLLLSSSLETFVCRGPLDIAIAVKCNPCLSSPCQHNSTCSHHPTEYYQCTCQSGFKGRHCEMPIDPCILEPCNNGGRCIARDEAVYTCECPVGFSGDRCEVNVDDCTPTSCPVSNATCVDGVNEFTCKCPVGWMGNHCSEQIPDPCTLEQPCQNGGSCVLVQEIDSISYRCDCDTGYRGVNCTDRFDPCRDHKCENAGICERNPQSAIGYQCNCQGEYRGQYCTFPMNSVDVLQDDPCSDNDCQHGSLCYVEQGRGYSCVCLPGYTGDKCEKLVSVSFHRNGSFIKIPQPGLLDTNFTLTVSTTQPNGVLLYDGAGGTSREHLAIEFFTGHVRVSFDLGSSPGSTIYSRVPINDGEAHKVELLIRDHMVSLKVDSGEAIVERMTSSMTSSSEVIGAGQFSPLFIGGIQTDLLQSARRLWHIRNTNSFKGCIHTFYINQTQLMFNDLIPHDDITNDIRPGCRGNEAVHSCSLERPCLNGHCIFDQSTGPVCRCDEGFTGDRCTDRVTPCTSNACQHGTCRVDGDSYTCQCEKGFSGRHCDTLDYCAGVDCRRGRCVSTDIGYQCVCKKRYTGRHCQTRIRPCPGTRIKQYYQVSKVSKKSRAVGGTTICRSRRRFTNMVCSGSCPANHRRQTKRVSVFGQADAASTSCCRPMRVQNKSIRMKCRDGTVMTHVLKKVKKCGCQSCS